MNYYKNFKKVAFFFMNRSSLNERHYLTKFHGQNDGKIAIFILEYSYFLYILNFIKFFLI